MEDEKKTGDRKMEEAIVGILGLLLLIQLLSGLVGTLGNNERTAGVTSYLGIYPPLTEETPVGTAVATTRDATLFADPGADSEVIGVIPRDSKGTIIDGPVLLDGELWWEVEFADGSTGWVRNDELGRDVGVDSRRLNENTPRGTKVVHVAPAEILSRPGEGGTVANANVGNIGTIVGGPVDIDGELYWQVRYGNNVVGWVPQSSLEVDVARNSSAITDATPFGTAVQTIENNLDVWSAPRGGTILGSQPLASEGILVNGSVTIGTTRWWDVDFDFGADGWVLESGLAIQQPVASAAKNTLRTVKQFSYMISALLFVFAVIIFIKYQKLLRIEHENSKPLSWSPFQESSKDERWTRVMNNVASNSENDWRLAILEADIILDDALQKLNLPGDTIGERLRALSSDRLQSYREAGEAHGIRNRIAHSGGDYQLSIREAKRVINLYKKVLEELDVI